MNWLLLNETEYYGAKIDKVAINPSQIVAIRKRDDEAKIDLADGSSLCVTESFEEVMSLLGNNCDWRLP